MSRAHWAPAILSLFMACSPAPTPAPALPPAPPAGPPPALSAIVAPAPSHAKTAADWIREADEAQKQGILDLANACRGRAYGVDRSPETLRAWIDGLLAAGEPELARKVWSFERARAEQKGGTDIVKAIDARINALPPKAPPGAIAPAAISAPIRAAYEAEADGRLDDAIAAFEKALGPTPDAATLAHAADLSFRKRDIARARRGWSAARTLLREAGAGFEIVPVRKWFTEDASFFGEKLALLRKLQPVDDPSKPMSALELWSLGAAPAPAIRFQTASNLDHVVFLDDGVHLVHAEGGAIVMREILSGVPIWRFETGVDRLAALEAVGSGDALILLTAAGPRATVWNGKGQALASYHLEGTTPTITRVYRAGQGTHHDNILRDDPTWAVAAAISSDGRFIAVGGSDSKVRVFDRTTGNKRTLEFSWSYEERRHLGGNPDLNVPLDMRFSARGAKLVVAYQHGEMITWGTADGRKIRAIDGGCSVEEATISVNRFEDKGAPRRAPTDAERASCGWAKQALFRRDLGSIVTAGQGVRVRSVDSGAGAAFMIDNDLIPQYLTWSPAGTLAVGDIYGSVSLWSPGDRATRQILPKSPSGPIDPHITSNGRVLWFEVDQREYVWDLVAKKPIMSPASATESILAISSDGRIAAKRLKDAVEFQNLETGSTIYRIPHPAGERVWVKLAARGKKALAVLERYPARSLALCDLSRGACNPLPFGAGSGTSAISEDGRWIAAEEPDHTVHVWEASSGKSVLDLGQHVHSIAFSADGDVVTWLEQPVQGVRHIKAHMSRLDNRGQKTATIERDGWPADIAISADGSDIWVFLEGSLHRWKPGVDTGVDLKDLDFISARRIQMASDGKTLLLDAYDRIFIRSTDAGVTPIATVYPLLSGGVLAVSASGAVDGSADAPDHVVTRVMRGDEALVFDGRLGWDAAHVEGVVARALEGEDVDPPIPGANGSSGASL